MAHGVWDDRFLERDGKARAWHVLGTTFAANLNVSAKDAFATAGLNFRVIKVPQLFANPATGETQDTGKFLLYREAHTFNGKTSPGVLLNADAPVSASYTVIDNMDIAAALDPLAKEWPLETVGALHDGGVIFVTLFGGDFDIKGDHCQMYFLVQDGKDGLRSMRIATTPVRVVCQNTLTLGLNAANFSVKVEHDAEAYRNLEFWAGVIPQIRDSAKRTKDALALLAEVRATKPMVSDVFEAAFKDPGKSERLKVVDMVPLGLSQDAQALVDSDLALHTKATDRIAEIRDAAWERYDVFNQENPNVAGTLYAAAQAANEVSMWRRGHATTIDQSCVFGPRAEESKRAFKTAYALATKRASKEMLAQFSLN